VVLRCPLEGVRWLPNPAVTLKVAGNSGISQARTHLGWAPLQQLRDDVVRPSAGGRRGVVWRLGVCLGKRIVVFRESGKRSNEAAPKRRKCEPDDAGKQPTLPVQLASPAGVADNSR